MERLNKARNAMRLAFEQLVEQTTLLLSTTGSDYVEVQTNFTMLTRTHDCIIELDDKIFGALLDANVADTELNAEVESRQEYLRKFTTIKLLIDNLTLKTVTNDIDNVSISSASNRRKFTLPKIEIKRFGGDIKDWLPFWSQFRKIHEDEDIVNEDKFQYLLQAITPGTRAQELVDSYPPTADNYSKVIESLSARFGRDDLLVEVYVRELLRLVLHNVIPTGGEKLMLSTLYDRLETQLRALETLGVTSDTCAAMLFPLVESALPEELLRAWQRGATTSSGTDNSMKDRLTELMKFLKNEVEGEERISLAVAGFGLGTESGKKKKKFRQDDAVPTAMGLFVQNSDEKCVFCAGTHANEECFKAQKISLAEKKSKLSYGKCCFNCLKSGHIGKKCKASLRCVICGGRHAVLMCTQLEINKTVSTKPSNKPQTECSSDPVSTTTAVVGNACTNNSNAQVLLQTLRVVLSNDDKRRVLRALIDTGSQKSYIKTDTALEMGYESLRKQELTHVLFGGAQTKAQVHNCYQIRVESLDNEFQCTFEVLDQPVICNDVTAVSDGPWMDELRKLGVELSDFEQKGPIEILIGADIVGKLLTGRRLLLGSGLVAIDTLLGWTIMGKIPNNQKNNHSMLVTSLFAKEVNIADLWSLDALGIEDPGLKKSRSEMEEAAINHFQETVTVTDDGRYEVEMPWIEGHAPIPNNFNLAKKRLESLLKKLDKDGLRQAYHEVINEWLSEGIIEEVSEAVPEEVGHYLPHRHVVKANSTTRIRPVFDASARERNQPSLNQCLEKGVNTIELIPVLLIQFRMRKIGVISDIKKAFLQISLSEKERDFLRFIWIDADRNIKIYRHTRVVFGVSCSPFLLGAVIQYHLNRFSEDIQSGTSFFSSNVLQQLMRSFYVDNCITSVDNESQLHDFIEQSTKIMAKGRFELRGWEYTMNEGQDKEPRSPVLGLMWNQAKDTLQISIDGFPNMTSEESVTKRKILSVVHKLYDPIGFTCPAAVETKVLLQKTWKSKLGWDVEVDEDVRKSFLKWVEELPELVNIKIPRWMTTGNKSCKRSLHTFCDASQVAYATVIFLRTETEDGVYVQLIQAKSRVAPTKKTTIPRLELLAATIGARLSKFVIESLGTTDVETYWWTDATTVLSWIQRDDQWTPFVWNRTQEIRRLTNREQWHHVPGEMNPADLPSRGCSPKKLIQSRWWEGPDWLKLSQDSWPAVRYVWNEDEINLERKKGVVSNSTLLHTELKIDQWYCAYFATYKRMINLIAWMLRFTSNCRKDVQNRVKGILNADELNRAEETIIRIVQQECFSESDKRLESLCPFIDENGIVRIKTKILRREDERNFRYPIVLPAQHPVVTMLIRETHEKSCHIGVQGLLSFLRERFWIIGGRKTVRTALSKCVICKKQESKRFETKPAALPVARVRDAAVFEITGVDMAGPLYLKNGKKAWICLFTCAVYRAIHLELVTSLSTDGFLQAFRRFVARRGRPSIVYSDNGTNFVGAVNAFARLDWDKISKYSTIQRIKWIFNPPSAPWWGGWWERLIRMVKQLLRKVLGRASLHYEELATVLCDCEAIINSRPLTYVSDDPADLMPLTPATFLQEVREIGLPDCDAIDASELNRRSRYRQKLKEDLRKRFRTEYLGQLVHRYKNTKLRSIKVGEIVLVGNDNVKRLDWPLARVEKLLPGQDGNTRLVKLKTATGSLIRPLQRLYPLEVVSQVPEQELQTADQELQVPELELPTTDQELQVPEQELQPADQEQEVQSDVDPKPIVTRAGRKVKMPKRLTDF